MDKDIKTMNVFSSRNFRLLFLEGLISEIGYALYSFAVSFYILELSGNNAFIQGLFVGVCSAAMLIAMPFGGVLGDRNSKRQRYFSSAVRNPAGCNRQNCRSKCCLKSVYNPC